MRDTNLKLARMPARSPLPVAALPSMSLAPLAPFILSILLILSEIKKPCAEIAWPSLAPFGGITRIRFKGFVSTTSQPSGSPALSFSVRIRPTRAKSMVGTSRCDVAKLLTRIYPEGFAAVSCFTFV